MRRVPQLIKTPPRDLCRRFARLHLLVLVTYHHLCKPLTYIQPVNPKMFRFFKILDHFYMAPQKGGMYLVDLLDIYGPSIAILFVVLVETVGVCWFYGTDRFSNDVETMLGFRPGPFWRITWAYISPLFLLVVKLR